MCTQNCDNCSACGKEAELSDEEKKLLGEYLEYCRTVREGKVIK